MMSLDAYRGFIMLFMASAGFAIPEVARKHFPDSSVWQFLSFHTSHVEWLGCSFWDLIQPSFMFMVGVALPYSYASRKAKGTSDSIIFLHVLWRSLLLVLLGVFLSSTDKKMTNWVFPNVLCQIGLGYPFLYLLLGRKPSVQLLALVGIAVGYTLFFGLWPLPSADFDYQTVRTLKEDGAYFAKPYLEGWFGHWDKNTNAAAAFDDWFLNLFPRSERFKFNNGGYQTLNFVPSLITMLLGLMAGEWLRRPGERIRHFKGLVLAGVVCLFVGLLMGATVCPIIKRIWTPSWAVYSSGWTFLMLAGFYGVIDLAGWRRWAFALVVVGMNSIAMYCMSQLFKGFVRESLRIHLGWMFGPNTFLTGPLPGLAAFSEVYGPIVLATAALLVLWLVCLWMYRRGLFLKI
jgi:predicted acyltransferase